MQLQLGKSSGKEQTIFERPVLLAENEKYYLNVQDIRIFMWEECVDGIC